MTVGCLMTSSHVQRHVCSHIYTLTYTKQVNAIKKVKKHKPESERGSQLTPAFGPHIQMHTHAYTPTAHTHTPHTRD